MELEKGIIQSVVGTGEEGYRGDGGPATLALTWTVDGATPARVTDL